MNDQAPKGKTVAPVAGHGMIQVAKLASTVDRISKLSMWINSRALELINVKQGHLSATLDGMDIEAERLVEATRELRFLLSYAIEQATVLDGEYYAARRDELWEQKAA